jgi:hypothetical protein
MRRLVDHGRDGGDPSFYFREFAARQAARSTTKPPGPSPNPALDDFLHRDALRATLPPKMRENAFRRYRLGQWVAQDGAWLPDGAWARCADAARVVPDGADVMAAFDGSFSRDCSVLALATIEPRPHVWLERIWGGPGGPPRLACARGRGRRRPVQVAAVPGSARRRRHPGP